MSAVIQGDTVLFKNRYGLSNITLKHYDTEDGYKLIFNSDVVYQKSLQVTKIEFEGMSIEKDDDKMIFKKGDKTLMILQE